MKSVPLFKFRPEFYEPVAKQLEEVFYKILFAPLYDVLAEAGLQVLTNAYENALLRALKLGQVQYDAGVFSGKFKANIALVLRDLGATFNKRKGVYTLKPELVPGWVKEVAGLVKQKARTVHDDIKKALDQTQRDLERRIEAANLELGKTLDRTQQAFKKVGEALGVSPVLSPESRERLSKDYNENMKLWINKFSQEEIQKLRSDVEENALAGYRFDTLAKRIKQRNGVSNTKAKFLARQETSLFVSKFRQQRYKEAGVEKYEWLTAQDERVRVDHKHLNRTIQTYSQPPVVDKASGRRANPGEDFGCRCLDRPILEEAA